MARMFPFSDPCLPHYKSLLVQGGYHPSAPIHMCLSVPSGSKALLLSSRKALICIVFTSITFMASGEETSFISFLLKPGSSLHPTFLLAVDAAFALLFVVFLWSAYLTKGNPHFFVLMGIQLALWGSIKCFVDMRIRISSRILRSMHRFVQELKKLPPADTTTNVEASTRKKEQRFM
ncbi:hypothetical protein AZE42_10007 [Rhizopogon vesiculosus]|uniref:Uncharacterized protein n=1 Tax=Rhizopogon vesiculosus TaxID=180088 RepID=A0A1J8Q087_9AGAM|nr:hypothetical protein AZE42_10007 [Rhizopogon vesiculosus]